MDSKAHVASQRSINLKSYITLARPDHWFKNVFMLLGVILAFFIEPNLINSEWHIRSLIALTATCLLASSNYVINDLLDAPQDRLHPTKRDRPVPSGRVWIPLAYIQWLLLAVVGLGISYLVNSSFLISALAFWVSGIVYNVPPIRTKDIPYIDVLTESLNNPIRLFLGWFVLIPDQIPPLSLIISYWMAGAFFMGSKRIAEYNMINDPIVAGNYRNSFKHYDGTKLIISQFFYVASFSFFFSIFIVRYHLELILITPLIAGFFAYYMKLSFKPNSFVQTPEKLYKEFGFVFFTSMSFLTFIFLLFIKIHVLYDIFNVIPYKVITLWSF